MNAEAICDKQNPASGQVRGRCGWSCGHSRAPFGCGFAAMRCIAGLHSARRWETPVRGTDPALRRLQVGDTAPYRRLGIGGASVCPEPPDFARDPQVTNLRYKSALRTPATR